MITLILPHRAFFCFCIIRGLPIVLTLGFCVATVAIFMLDAEESCSRLGVLRRIPEDELATPEEFLKSRASSVVSNSDQDSLSDEERGDTSNISPPPSDEADKGEEDEEAVPTEATPLISNSSLDV